MINNKQKERKMNDLTIGILCSLSGVLIFSLFMFGLYGRMICFWEFGKNDDNESRVRLIEDLNRARRQVAILTYTGRDGWWGHAGVIDAIKKAVSRSVIITFIVTPEFDNALEDSKPENRNTVIRQLAADGIIQLFRFPDHPGAGYRLIDNKGVYVCRRQNDSRDHPHKEREFLRLWGHRRIARMQQELFSKILRKSRQLKYGGG